MLIKNTSAVTKYKRTHKETITHPSIYRSPKTIDSANEDENTPPDQVEFADKSNKKEMKSLRSEVTKIMKQHLNHGKKISGLETAVSVTASEVDAINATLSNTEEEVTILKEDLVSTKEDLEILSTRVRTDTVTEAAFAHLQTRVGHVEMLMATQKRRNQQLENSGPTKISKGEEPAEKSGNSSKPEAPACCLCDGQHPIKNCSLFPTSLSRLNEFKKAGRCLKCATLGCSGKSQCPNSIRTCSNCKDRQAPPSSFHLSAVCLYDEIFVKRQRDKRERERRTRTMETPVNNQLQQSAPQQTQQHQMQQPAPQQVQPQQTVMQPGQQQVKYLNTKVSETLIPISAPNQQQVYQPLQPAQPVFAMPRVTPQQMMPTQMMYQQPQQQQYPQANAQGYPERQQQQYGYYTQY
ncbi:hypothetical protein CRE_22709 [Caenorhabditis remanei]|uniref:Uncharacterized protein n=1 Tax=Caenorhabditis remanei TaxID=31234 RepID=E3NJT9_CAERE|nr:hypothetical protein CRE_22709 [Caenorhabditis remanei]